MKLKFLHDSMRFNRETAREEVIKKGQTVEIPDEDAGAFLSGENPRAEIVSAKEKKEYEEAQKPEVVEETKSEPVAQKKAKATHTRKAKKK